MKIKELTKEQVNDKCQEIMLNNDTSDLCKGCPFKVSDNDICYLGKFAPIEDLIRLGTLNTNNIENYITRIKEIGEKDITL